MLVVVWRVVDREIKLYKNGELAFTMNTNDRLEDPTTVVLSVKEETCELYEPRCEKICHRGFRPGPTQTGLAVDA